MRGLREPTEAELRAIHWARLLDAGERDWIARVLRVEQVAAGDPVSRVGEPALHWSGVLDGMLKVCGQTEEHEALTFSGVPPGGWFGEGTLLKRGHWLFDVTALRGSTVARLPAQAFYALLDRSIAFNRFLMGQLNERLSQFIAAREIDRLNCPEERVARSLAWLCNPILFPGAGPVLRLTQQELAYLVGISRQRVGQALASLEQRNVLRVQYGSIHVIDREALAGALSLQRQD
jgi:CRP/FNR family transcriptional regulator, cyclic AMP receptor protein